MIIRFYDYEPLMVIAMIKAISPLKKKAKAKDITFEFINCDITNHNIPNTMYVSPANSFVTMGGGLDGILDDMFKIKEKAYDKVKLYGTDNRTSLGNKYLPVGEAVATQISKEKCQYLLSCPTMYYPTSIRGTDNVMNATLASLCLAEKIMHTNTKIKYLYLPGMGTGVGGMGFNESAKLMAIALHIYLSSEKVINKFPWDYYSPLHVKTKENEKK